MAKKQTTQEKAEALTTLLRELTGKGDAVLVVWVEGKTYKHTVWKYDVVEPGYYQVRVRYPRGTSSGKDGRSPMGTFGTIKSPMSYLRGWLTKWVEDRRLTWGDAL